MSEISTIDQILIALSRHSLAHRIRIFGSVAAGSGAPRDVDAVVDLRALTRGEYLSLDPQELELRPLLELGRRHYGWLDPFVRFSDELVVRNDTSTAWVRAKNKGALINSIEGTSRPLADILGDRHLQCDSPKAPAAMPVRRIRH